MAIPLALTQITVTRANPADDDGYDPTPATPITVAAGVRAAITSPSGVAVLTGGTRAEYTVVLNCDPCDVRAGDMVTDGTGQKYQVLVAWPRIGLGLDHIEGRMRYVTGAF